MRGSKVSPNSSALIAPVFGHTPLYFSSLAYPLALASSYAGLQPDMVTGKRENEQTDRLMVSNYRHPWRPATPEENIALRKLEMAVYCRISSSNR
ncbi:hypothetical protein MSG28_003346 [Choristoneura fumiferana]|uniref:Uncharacterized protein n=1 Tax=Choristoneura fumiferana TaxID=7141 RepID=A0ACC0KF60_CHOFU|nr:hypothetical protein MSG28_003346 [Choristoneura fumiferana]